MDRGLLGIDQAVVAVRGEGVIAYPTEAVYGLGCSPQSESAVRTILQLKSRPASAGLILIADCFERFADYVQPVADDLLARAMATWPGPVTWLFPRAAQVPDWLAGQHQTIAVRVSAHPVCAALCQALQAPLVSTSANPHGQPPALTAEQVRGYFAGTIDGIVAGSLGERARPSEIRDLQSGAIIRT